MDDAEPSCKRQRTELAPIQRLPRALLTELWSFIPDLEAPELVPDREHFEASLLSRKTCTYLHLSEQWCNLFGTLPDEAAVIDKAKAIFALYSPSRVKHVHIRVANVPRYSWLIQQIAKTFAGIETLWVYVFSTEMDLSSRGAVTDLIRMSPELRWLAIDMYDPVTESVAQSWLSKEVALAVPYDRLTQFSSNGDMRFIKRLSSSSRLSCVTKLTLCINEIDLDDLDEVLEKIPQLEQLWLSWEESRDSTQQERVASLQKLFSIVCRRCPGLDTLHMTVWVSMEYPEPKLFETLFDLKSLQYLYIGLKDVVGVKWPRTPDAKYNDLAWKCMDAWPSLVEIGIGLPVTNAFFEQADVAKGRNLQCFSVYHTELKPGGSYNPQDVERWSNSGGRKNVVVY